MKIAFLGTSEFAVPALQALAAEGHDIVAVYTRAPRPAGRGQQERKTPVHQAADALGLPIRTPRNLKGEEDAAAFRALDLDVAVVVSYGHILPKSFLEAPVLGCINIHGSLLPRWRGAAPIHRAILAGDAETGVTIMRMDEGLDTGPMLLAERTPISAGDTAQSVHDRLAELGGRLIVSTLDGLMRRTIEPVPQPDAGVTYAHKLGKEEGARLHPLADDLAVDLALGRDVDDGVAEQVGPAGEAAVGREVGMLGAVGELVGAGRVEVLGTRFDPVLREGAGALADGAAAADPAAAADRRVGDAGNTTHLEDRAAHDEPDAARVALRRERRPVLQRREHVVVDIVVPADRTAGVTVESVLGGVVDQVVVEGSERSVGRTVGRNQAAGNSVEVAPIDVAEVNDFRDRLVCVAGKIGADRQRGSLRWCIDHRR